MSSDKVFVQNLLCSIAATIKLSIKMINCLAAGHTWINFGASSMTLLLTDMMIQKKKFAVLGISNPNLNTVE